MYQKYLLCNMLIASSLYWNNQVEFHLTGNAQAHNNFRIDSYSEVISLITSPVQDRVINQFTLTVSLTDKGVPPRTAGTATVLVNVLRNEQSPAYFNKTYYVELSENVPLGTSVVQVSATESDTKTNRSMLTSDISFKFLEENTSSVFNINTTSGKITTAVALDYESQAFYNFTVIAVYSNGIRVPSATTFVQITVLDQNDNTPMLQLSTQYLSVPRNAGVNIVLTGGTASDGDAPGTVNSEVEFTIASVEPSCGLGLFSINRLTGQLVNIESFTKYLNHHQYKITIMASDKGTPARSSTVLFTLNITTPNYTKWDNECG